MAAYQCLNCHRIEDGDETCCDAPDLFCINDMPGEIVKLRALVKEAQVQEPETCTWHQDGDSDSGVYATSCGHYFNLEDGTPADNKMQWCCYCGKKLAQELIEENKDD